MSPVLNGATLIIEVLLGLFLLALVLRFLFQLLRVDFRNPISQAIVKITGPVIIPLRKFIPGLWGMDLSSLLMILVVGGVKFYAIATISGYQVNPLQALLFGFAETLTLVTWIMIVAILGSAILSWVAPRSHHPAAQILTGVSRPLVAPFRRFIPSLGGIDISPIFALLAIQLVQTTGIPLLKQLFVNIAIV